MANLAQSAPFGFQYPAPGASSALEYMASGLPFVTASSGAAKVEFPFVTNFVRIQNMGDASLRVGFTANGVLGTNYFTITSGSSVEVPFRIMDLHITGSDNWELIAGLTQIPRKNFFILTGALDGFSGSQEDYGLRGFGFNGLG